MDLLCCKTQDRSEYIALWIPSLLSFSSVSCKNSFPSKLLCPKAFGSIDAGSLTFCSSSGMMFLSARPLTSGNESSTAMAISVRSCFNRERRFASLNSSILNTICLLSKHNSDLTGPLTGALHARGVSSLMKEAFYMRQYFMLTVMMSVFTPFCMMNSHHCITAQFTYIFFISHDLHNAYSSLEGIVKVLNLWSSLGPQTTETVW